MCWWRRTTRPSSTARFAIGARIVGVNSRSLQTFGEDLGVAEGLAARIPDDVVAVAESAIRSVEDAQRMADAGFDAVLVGEGLVRARSDRGGAWPCGRRSSRACVSLLG